MGAGWHCRRLLSLLARVPAQSYLQTPPASTRADGAPVSQPGSALSSECAEGVTPADSNKQVGVREVKNTTGWEAIFVSKNIQDSNAMLALASRESEFQKANKEA